MDKVIKKHLHRKFSRNQNQLKNTSGVYYFKLPYICNLSHHIKNKLLKLCKDFCKENFNIKIVCFYHVAYEFESESTLYSCLNVKELLVRSRRHI